MSKQMIQPILNVNQTIFHGTGQRGQVDKIDDRYIYVNFEKPPKFTNKTYMQFSINGLGDVLFLHDEHSKNPEQFKDLYQKIKEGLCPKDVVEDMRPEDPLLLTVINNINTNAQRYLSIEAKACNGYNFSVNYVFEYLPYAAINVDPFSYDLRSLYKINQETPFSQEVNKIAIIELLMHYNRTKHKPDCIIRILGSDETKAVKVGPVDKLGHSLASYLRCEYKTDLLYKSEKTRDLRGLGQAERIKELAGKYYIKNATSLGRKKILVIDDVLTTGATMCDVTRALNCEGILNIDYFVIAKTKRNNKTDMSVANRKITKLYNFDKRIGNAYSPENLYTPKV